MNLRLLKKVLYATLTSLFFRNEFEAFQKNKPMGIFLLPKIKR